MSVIVAEIGTLAEDSGMPTYVYEVIREDGSGGEVFEVVQKMSDPPLTHHPETEQPVRRVIQPPYLPQRWTEGKMKSAMSDRNLAEKGFTKYVKTADGRYEKTTGQAPVRLGSNR